MNWSESLKADGDKSNYDHVKCESPLGVILIEWKSWKDSPSYGIGLEGQYLGSEYSLEDAKEKAREYLENKYNELGIFLKIK